MFVFGLENYNVGRTSGPVVAERSLRRRWSLGRPHEYKYASTVYLVANPGRQLLRRGKSGLTAMSNPGSKWTVHDDGVSGGPNPSQVRTQHRDGHRTPKGRGKKGRRRCIEGRLQNSSWRRTCATEREPDSVSADDATPGSLLSQRRRSTCAKPRPSLLSWL